MVLIYLQDFFVLECDSVILKQTLEAWISVPENDCIIDTTALEPFY